MSASLNKKEIEKLIRQEVGNQVKALTGKKVNTKRDWDQMIDDRVGQALEKALPKAIEKEITKRNGKTDRVLRELITDVFTKYHRALWIRRNFWQNDIKK